MVVRFGIHGSCYVSSFDHDVLGELESINQKTGTQVDQVYLYNYYNTDELPSPEIYATKGRGINISSTKLTRDVVEACHTNGKLVGVWIDRDYASEGEEFYQLLYQMDIDFFCSDYPH
jgi:glycerophosphoryl diester phosphodiesterase